MTDSIVIAGKPVPLDHLVICPVTGQPLIDQKDLVPDMAVAKRRELSWEGGAKRTVTWSVYAHPSIRDDDVG